MTCEIEEKGMYEPSFDIYSCHKCKNSGFAFL